MTDWLKLAGCLIFERMLQKSWNQKQLAAEARCAPSTVNRILHGDQNATIGTLQSVARAVDLDLQKLFGQAPESRSLEEAQKFAPLIQLRALVEALPDEMQTPILEKVIPGLIDTWTARRRQNGHRPQQPPELPTVPPSPPSGGVLPSELGRTRRAIRLEDERT